MTPKAARSTLLAVVLAVEVFALVLGLLAGFAFGFEEAVLGIAGACTLMVLSLPVHLRKNYDILEPLSLVIFITMIGVTLKIPYATFGDTPFIREFVLLGRQPAFLLHAALVVLVGSTFLTMGYISPRRRIDISRLPILKQTNWSRKRLALVLALCGAISIGSIFLYAQAMGIHFDDLSSISAKRFYYIESAVTGYGSLGYTRWGASLAELAFYVLLAWQCSRRSARAWSLSGVSLIVLALLAMTLPVLSNTRQSAVLPLFSAFVIAYYLKGIVRVRTVFATFGSGLIVVMLLTAFRVQKVDEVTRFLRLEAVVETILGSRHFAAIDRTAHILDGVPERLDYRHGTTLFNWALMPVPRSMWPAKPFLGIGKEIARDIFRYESRAGVPPGIICELVINFGLLGVPFGMFVVGYFLRSLYLSFRPHRGNRNAIILYAAVLYSATFTLLNNEVSQAAVGVFLRALPLIAILSFLGVRRREVPAQAQSIDDFRIVNESAR